MKEIYKDATYEMSLVQSRIIYLMTDAIKEEGVSKEFGIKEYDVSDKETTFEMSGGSEIKVMSFYVTSNNILHIIYKFTDDDSINDDNAIYFTLSDLYFMTNFFN